VRIWHSYGSEHSMDLVLVGTFETVSGAEAAIERMEALKTLAEAAGPTTTGGAPTSACPTRSSMS
jgi:hypothetical protein